MTASDRPDAESRATGDAVLAARVLRYVVLIVLALLFVSPLLFMLVDVVQDPGGGRPRRRRPGSPTRSPRQAYDAHPRRAPTRPVFRWFLNSMIAATANAAARRGDGGAGGVRPGPDGVPRQEDRLRR